MDPKQHAPKRPHDALFKYVFEQPEHAAGLLRMGLPDDIVAQMDFATLAAAPTELVSEVLNDRRADLLFTVEVGGEKALVFVLIEHRSSLDRWLPFQVLVYVVRIWERWRRDNPGAGLPPILPLLVYHGERPWRRPLDLNGLFEGPEWLLRAAGPHLPRLEVYVEDLSIRSEEELRHQPLSALGKLACFALQRARDAQDIAPALARWHSELRAAEQEALRALFRYIYTVNEATSVESMNLHLRPLDQDREGAPMANGLTVWEQAWLEGAKSGVTDVLVRQLKLKFGVDIEEMRPKLVNTDPETLLRWSDAVLTASTLEEVFATE